MENASKALIMAASVLLAIMIIAMGVTIFNKAQSSADTTSLDATEISMFNSKFERYSDNQLGSQVKSLVSFAISNASTNKEDPSQLPTITLDSTGNGSSDDDISATGGSTASSDISTYINTLGKVRNAITSTHQYEVELSYGTSGLINTITIKY